MALSMNNQNFSGLETLLKYTFQDRQLLAEALSHSSFVNELADNELRDNERLEFLGDAVLNLAVGHILMQRFPDVHEGDLSRMRAHLVNETQLADLARRIELGSYLQLGKGEIQTQGSDKNSILADAFEALLAAVYLDGGFQTAFHFIEDCFAELLDLVHQATENQDFKSQLQELVQSRYQAMPRYKVIEESGPDHDKTFRVQMSVREMRSEGVGKSKKTAEQDAARNAFDMLTADT